MHDPSDDVVVQLGGGKGAVTALVGENPKTSTEQSLEEGVQTPESEACRVGGDVLGGDEVVEEVEGGGEAGKVADNVSHTEDTITLEAVLWDGVTELLDCEVRNLEGVAIGVDQLAIRGLLFTCGIEGGH